MVDRYLLLLWGCGVAFGVLIGYAYWIRIRVVGLKADLAKIYLETRDIATAMRRSGDPGFERSQRILLGFIHRADEISIPAILYIHFKTSAHREEMAPNAEGSSALDHESAAALAGARQRVSGRIADYLLKETLCGRIILVMLWAFPALTRDEIELGAWGLIGPWGIVQSA